MAVDFRKKVDFKKILFSKMLCCFENKILAEYILTQAKL